MKEERKPFVFKSTLLGYVAMWATHQSPYHAPDGLSEVLMELGRRINVKEYDLIPATKENLRHIMYDLFLPIPQVQRWNERKNGNTNPLGFYSAYDSDRNPDDDFIDLDALAYNIISSCIKEDQESWDDHMRYEQACRWTLKKMDN